MSESTPLLNYHAASFSAGRMDFAWEELSEEARAQAYADWEAGKGLIGGDPRRRPNSHLLPAWGIDRPFSALALDDARGQNGDRLAGAARLGPARGGGDRLRPRRLPAGPGARHPDTLFLGYETKTKAARLCLQRIERYAIDNLWLSDDDCRFNLPRDRRRSPGHGPCALPRPVVEGAAPREALILAAVCRPVGGEAAAGRAAAFQERCAGVRRVGRLPRGAARRVFGT